MNKIVKHIDIQCFRAMVPHEFRPVLPKRGLPYSDGCPLRKVMGHFPVVYECSINWRRCGDMCFRAVHRMLELIEAGDELTPPATREMR